MSRRAGCAGLWLALLGGCAAGQPAVLDAGFPAGRRTAVLARLAEAPGLTAGEAFRAEEIGRDAHTSHHLVWIREGERPHRHDRHDLLVVLLRGQGSMRLGDEARAVGTGSILYVPRGTPHAFRNFSDEPAAAYVMYLPGFDGRDRIDLESAQDASLPLHAPR